MIKEKIVGYLKESVGKTREDFFVEVFVPEKEQFGHYSSSAAIRLAKEFNRNSMETAEKIKNALLSGAAKDFFEKIEIAPPGFINFWLSGKALQDELKEILKKKESYGAGKKKKEKIDMEFISANPTGELTIGNGRGGFFGDVLANVLSFVGYKVIKEYYVNDAETSAQIKELGKTALGGGTTYLTENLKNQISRLKRESLAAAKFNRFKNLKTEKLKNNLYGEAGHLLAREVQKDNKKFIVKDLKIKFDKWFSEESLYRSGAVEELLAELKSKNLTYEKEGALWLKTKSFGDGEDRVLVRRSRFAGEAGEPTYFIPDLAYHLNKFRTRKFDKVIDIWGADHHGYEPRLRAGLKALGIFKNGDGKFRVVITQLARLVKDGKEVKMSKRKGEFVTLGDLVKEVGVDAARFFFLMSSPDTHMNFDLSLAKERSMKNPVYYAQYAAVRCQGILRKSKIKNFKSKINFGLLNAEKDVALMRQLARFPEVAEAATNFNPQFLARYSLDLARAFHGFYEKERIIGEEKELAAARLSLVRATFTLFKSVFSLLGISIPEKM